MSTGTLHYRSLNQCRTLPKRSSSAQDFPLFFKPLPVSTSESLQKTTSKISKPLISENPLSQISPPIIIPFINSPSNFNLDLDLDSGLVSEEKNRLLLQQTIKELTLSLPIKFQYIIKKTPENIKKFLSLKGYSTSTFREAELLKDAAEVIQSRLIEETEFNFYINFKPFTNSTSHFLYRRILKAKHDEEFLAAPLLSWVKA